MLTKNAEATLDKTLQALQSFPEIVILDNGSTDGTLDLARQFANVRIHQMPFIGFGPLRNEAVKFASNDWILAIDSDEIPSPSLLSELQNLQLDPHQVYALPRHNYYRGKKIRGCGWGSEWVVRLYHRKQARFSDSEVHESLIVGNLKVVRLSFPLIHTPYRSTAEFLAKMQHYSTLFAKQNQGKKKSSLGKAIGHGLFAFLRSYLIKGGFLSGKEGFIISIYNGNTAFYKYLKLDEKRG